MPRSAAGQGQCRPAQGKIVLDTCNPYLDRDGDMPRRRWTRNRRGRSDILRATRLVRAFNQVNAKSLASEAHRAGELIGVPLAGDDKRRWISPNSLVTMAGFEPVVGGRARDR